MLPGVWIGFQEFGGAMPWSSLLQATMWKSIPLECKDSLDAGEPLSEYALGRGDPLHVVLKELFVCGLVFADEDL